MRATYEQCTKTTAPATGTATGAPTSEAEIAIEIEMVIIGGGVVERVHFDFALYGNGGVVKERGLADSGRLPFATSGDAGL